MQPGFRLMRLLATPLGRRVGAFLVGGLFILGQTIPVTAAALDPSAPATGVQADLQPFLITAGLTLVLAWVRLAARIPQPIPHVGHDTTPPRPLSF